MLLDELLTDPTIYTMMGATGNTATQPAAAVTPEYGRRTMLDRFTNNILKKGIPNGTPLDRFSNLGPSAFLRYGNGINRNRNNNNNNSSGSGGNNNDNGGSTTGSTPPVTPAYPVLKTKDAAMNAVNAAFNPGWQVGAVPTSLLDDAISSIMAEQQGAAQDYLNRGLARGIYNDVGYGAGTAALVNSAAMGRADLGGLGAGLIDKYRGELDAIGDDAYSAASGFMPGTQFSLAPYIQQKNELLSRINTNIGGDLRNLVGGRNYFDFAGLTNKAGLAQGATNLRDTDVATALAERKRQNAANRGLGSQGAF